MPSFGETVPGRAVQGTIRVREKPFMNRRILLWYTILCLLPALCLSSPAASVLWRQTLDGGAPDEGMSVKADASGNVYVAAMTYLPPRAWLSLIKLNEAGAEQWRTEIPVGAAGPPKSGSCQMAVVEGDAYVACHEDAADHGVFVTRCRADGSVAWRETCAEITWPTIFTSEGNAVYLTAKNSTGDLVLKKFGEAGLAWTVPITNASLSAITVARAIFVSSNDVFVTGSELTDEMDWQNSRIPAAFVVRCSAEGNLLWRRTLESTNRLKSQGAGVTQLTDGSIVMVGWQSRRATNGVLEFSSYLFLRLDADGNELLRSGGIGVPEVMMPLPGGDMLAATSGGYSFDPTRSAFVASRTSVSRVSANGEVQWVRSFGPRGGSQIRVAQFNADGHLLLGGYDDAHWSAPRNLFLSEVNAETGKIRNRKFVVPRVSRYGRFDFEIDWQSNFYFLGGDGTSWPNVILTKFRGLASTEAR